MESTRKQRRVLRTAFTKAHTTFLAIMDDQNSTREEKSVAYQLVETKMAELDAVHTQFNNQLFGSETSDEAVMKELETDDTYKRNYLTAKLMMTDWVDTKRETQHGPSITTTRTSREVAALRLPRIELPKFNGSVKEWLSF